MWSTHWAERLVQSELGVGLEKSGRSREDIHVNLWVWAAVADDPRQAIEDARGTVAFYAGLAQYQPYFEAHGFGTEARKLNEPIRQGDLAAAAKLVPDEMVRTICLVPPPWGLGLEATIGYQARIAKLIAEEV